MSDSKRTAAFLLALVIIAMILLSAAVTAVEAGHDCSGIDCPICRVVTALHSLIRIAAAAFAVSAAVFMSAKSSLGTARTANAFIADTPTAEKVKLLN